MDNKIVGTSWDEVLTLISTRNDLKDEMLCFSDEVQAIEHLETSSNIRETCFNWLNNLQNDDHKTDTKSIKFRERGNEIFKSKTNTHLALEAYTKAIFEAPLEGLNLAYAHANRAIVLMSLRNYEAAYNDCVMAIEHNYPSENLMRMYFRQAECAFLLKNVDNLEQCLHKLEGEIKNRSSSFAEQDKYGSLKKALEKMTRKEPVDSSVNPIKTPVLIEKSNEKQGRYIIAKEKINANDPICCETAFAFVPVYEGNSKYPPLDCQKCASTNVVPFPCNECGKTCYCSPKCRKQHHEIHRFECSGYKKDLWYLIGIAHLGLRTFLEGFHISIEKMEEFVDLTPKALLDKFLSISDADYETFQYGSVFRLITNLDKMAPHDFLQYSLTAFMLKTYLVEFTEFFDNLPEVCYKIMPRRSDWETWAGAVILRHIGQLVCNGHAISDVRTTSASQEDCLENNSWEVNLGLLHRYVCSSRVFTAIFPKISMFNHSCDQNIRNSFNNNQLTVYATRNIEENGEIFNCYGPNYKLMSNECRKAALKQQYCFDCDCRKCSSDEDESKIYEKLLCPTKNCGNDLYSSSDEELFNSSIVCEKCNKKLDTLWYRRIVDTFRDAQVAPESCVETFNAYDAGLGILSEFNETRVDLAHMIFTMYVPFAGIDNSIYDRLFNIAGEIVKIREHRFGNYSLEYITSCLYVIDLLAIKVACTNASMLDSNDQHMISQFEESLTILSKRSQRIFFDYIRKYLQQ